LKGIFKKRYGHETKELFGIEPKVLTAAEAGYNIGFREADFLQKRAVKTRRKKENAFFQMTFAHLQKN
jgi:hypothetical protein